jgi:non-canonical (house-cleaning) NTP pyrophosphatase
MRGARQRAEALQAKLEAEGVVADFLVGLGGGLDVVIDDGWKRGFLGSLAYVSDGEHGRFGCSGSIELPDALADEVLTRGTELDVAIDTYAGAVGIRDGGERGDFIGGLISRQESFRLAAIAAFAPFYNAKIYRARSAASN